jgi:hypothetical protein
MGAISPRIQPQGLQQIDYLNPLAAMFWLPSGNQFYEVHTKKPCFRAAGSKAIGPAPAGVGQAFVADGATSFAVATPVTLTGSFTISILAASSASTASMALGDTTSSNNFLWIDDGSSEGRWRISGGDFPFTNSNFTAMAVYTVSVLPPANGGSYQIIMYKNGVQVGVGSSGTVPSFVFNTIGDGFTAGSFRMATGGFIAGVYAHPTHGMTATEVADHAANFFGTLQEDSYSLSSFLKSPASTISASLGIETSAGLPASIGSATTIAASVATVFDAGLSASITAATITITSPTQYQCFQQNVATHTANFTISGTYTGTPTSIQASFNGSAWQTISASPTGGNYSGTFTGAARGQGTLSVRFSNDTSTNSAVTLITVGDGILVYGQSNNVGHAVQYVPPSNAVFQAMEYNVLGNFTPLFESASTGLQFSDRFTTSGAGPSAQCSAMNQSTVDGQGSYFGALATLIMATGTPVFFIPCAVGSTLVSDWQPGTVHNNPATLYGAAVTRALLHPCRYAVWWQGESDATAGTSTATYISLLNNVVNNFFADTGLKTVVYQINYAGGAYCTLAQYNTIVAGQQNVQLTNANACVGPNMNGLWTGNVHYQTSADIAAVSQTAFNVLGALFYGGTEFITNSPGQVTDVGQGASINVIPTTVSASTGIEIAAGLPAMVSFTNTINSALGLVLDAGLGASIVLPTVVASAIGQIVDAGLEATIVDTPFAGTVVNASVGSVTFLGLPFTQQPYTAPPSNRTYVVDSRSRIPIFDKSPLADLDYAFDWTAYLAEVSDSFSGTPTIAVSDGLTLQAGPAVHGGKVVFWLEGGTAGVYYFVTCTISTQGGRIDSRVIKVWCHVI